MLLSILSCIIVNIEFWYLGVIIGVSHGVTDSWKVSARQNVTNYLIDQAIHLLLIITIPILLVKHTETSYLDTVFEKVNYKFILAGIAVLTISKPVSITIERILIASDKKNVERYTNNAGKKIGLLERFLIILFIFFQMPLGIGFLITAKSIFRFNAINKDEKEEGEYILLGTLLSFTFAITIGLLINAIENS